MKTSYLFILSFIFHISSFAQEYTPFSFQNFNTEWTHHSYDENLLDKNVQAYFLEDIVIEEDVIYLVYSITALEWYYNGFLLEKLDATTGALLWEYTYFQENNHFRDSPSRITVKEDNSLVLSTFRQLNEENQETFWYASQMNNWIFNAQTGELLDTLTTLNEDPNHVDMVMNFNPFLGHTVQSVLQNHNDEYKYFLSAYNNLNDIRKIEINNYTLNSLGHPISEDSVFLFLKYRNINQSFTKKISSNNFFNYRKSLDSNNPIDSFNIEITHLDSNLNIIYSKNLTEDFFGEHHKMINIVDSTFNVLHFGELLFDDQPYRYLTLYIYDIYGNLIHQTPLEREDGSPLYSLNGFNILHIDDLNQTLLVSFNKNDTESYWEWFMVNKNGKIEQIGKTVLNNIHDDFSWYFFPVVNMKYLDDGKILLHARHLDREEGNNTTSTSIPSISLISLDKLSTTVSVENPMLVKEFTVYPNPIKSEVNIKESEKYKQYEIFTLSGDLVKRGILIEDKVNVQSLTNGLYILKLYDIENQIYMQKIVVQK